ncbi:cell division control protein Cdc6 [Haloprofundus sp. MHR1]|nr:cell division control protein Cdc6 [Haloprofundus sp. MHR1]
MRTTFRTERNVFTNKDVFKEGYDPDEILERDEEISEYIGYLEDALFGETPKNIIVYGNTGVGKTVVTDHVTQMLSSEAERRDEGVDIHVVKVNCGHHTSSYQAAVALVNEMRRATDREEIGKGYGFADAMDMLYSEVERREGTVYVILDEIDFLGDDDQILYELPRASANDYVERSHVGVIGISNDYTYRDNLSSKVKDTLQEDEIKFPPYDAAELRTILEDRADKGMKEDVLDGAVIPKCAAISARDSGSARQAIDLLREAGNVADADGRDEVGEADVDEAVTRVERGRLKDGIRDLTAHGKCILLSLARAYGRQETPLRLKELLPVYERVARGAGSDPLGEHRVRDHLADLTMLGFVEQRRTNKGRAGGQFYQYDLSVDAEAVFEVVSE